MISHTESMHTVTKSNTCLGEKGLHPQTRQKNERQQRLPAPARANIQYKAAARAANGRTTRKPAKAQRKPHARRKTKSTKPPGARHEVRAAPGYIVIPNQQNPRAPAMRFARPRVNLNDEYRDEAAATVAAPRPGQY